MLLHHSIRFRIRFTRFIAIATCLTLVVGALATSRLVPAGNAQGHGQASNGNGKARKVKATPPDKAKPKLTLPNLDEIRGHRENHPEIKPAVESLVRSKRKPLQKWDGRKVGDPGTTSRPQAKTQRGTGPSSRSGNSESADARFNHARRSAAAPPPLPDDSFVVNFVGNALGRSINGTEQAYWDDILRSAYYQGPDAVMTAAREMGRTIFQSKEYYERGRSNHDYVYDLYMTYLMRDPSNPDDGGWNFWTSICDAYGREAVRAAFDACGDFNTLVASITPNGGISSNVGSISSARIDAFNQSGDQIQARDAEWSLPLLSLPGRAGLDLGLGISYSSLVWTKSGPYLYFDEDISQISPGFHLGFASIQGPYFDALTHKKAYILVSSAGRRVELRQVGDGVYEAADSSHLQIVEGGHAAAQEVNWTNVSGVAVNGRTLAATYGYWAAGASSTQMISSGDGYVETTIAETNTYRMIGLGNSDNNQSYTDIDFAWYPAADGTLYIYESGAYVGSFGPYALGDGLRVAIEGGAVKYRKNGQLMYTSTHGPTYPLAVDTSFYNPGSTLNNVVIANGGGWTSPSGTLLLTSTDGTRIQYSCYASDWQATQIQDRNGNYLSINNDWRGDIQTITDTLGRVIYFNSDGNGNLTSITQYTGGGWHTWATFGWTAPLSMGVSTMSGVVGTYHGESVPVLRQVNLMDGSYYTFEYTGVGQVNIIRRYASDNSQQSYVVYDYDGATTDCPRIYQTRVWASGWNGSPGVPGEVATQFDVVGGGGHRMITPDGTSYIEYYGSGWQSGLVTDARVYAPGLQKQSVTSYTQDYTGVNFETNPRVAETNVYDAVGNRRRTTIDYTGSFGLPYQVTEYDANASNVLRYTRSEYVEDEYYTSRRVIGLLSRLTIYNAGGGVESRTSYGHDAGSINPQAQYATQHNSAYDTNYYARGNVTEVFRWDATDPDNQSKRLTTELTYDAAGNLLTTADPLNHTATLNYSDSFSDSTNHNAYAYPGIVTDADNNSSYMQYNFDFGQKTRTEGAAPAGQSYGAIAYFYYDGARRLYEIYNGNTGGATYFGYGPNYTQTWASINSLYDNYSFRYIDGLGRETVSSSYHPSTGTYGTQLTSYDVMGRVSQQSNPTEMYGNWSPSADEAGGWVYKYQTYDWKGRPLVTTNQDGIQNYASYSSCGCAGSEIATLTDEVGRQQKIYSDVLGRQSKTEVLNWNGSVYSTRAVAYNARDQITSARQYQGPDYSGVYQEETASYDGYGRLATRQAPIQTAATTYTYYPNDKPQTVTDARGVTTSYSYNNRGLITGVSSSGGGYAAVSMSYGYDAAGNRTSMSDDSGYLTYQYDSLSRLVGETKQFSGSGVPAGSYSLSYEYNLAGELKAITDPTGSRVDYSFDSNGRLTSVSGSGANSVPTYASGFAYRAWGAVKDFDLGNGVHQHLNFNYRLQNSSMALTNLASGGSMSWSYDYYADGKVHTVSDSADPRFDRYFDYDQAGRIANAFTGNEARGGSTPDGPFKQTFDYDVWENTTSRVGRIWTQPITNGGANYSNNRHQYWFYDNQGNATATFDANFSYDAAGRNNYYSSNAYVNETPILQVAQSLDGNSVPASKTETRIEDPNAPATVTKVFYLRSTALGGKVVAELNETGYKRKGYIYAGGMQIAQQDIWNPGYGSQVTWNTTNPVTGSTYLSDTGPYAVRQEIDPLGTDVTSPPAQLSVEEPAFYNSKFDQMPLEYEWGPSQEALDAMAWYEDQLYAAEHYQENLALTAHASQLWQSGDRSGAEAIIANNPNIGVQTVDGTNRWGRDAADFLRGLGNNVEVVEQFGGSERKYNHAQKTQSAEEQRLGDALKELQGRLEANGGDNGCAGFFGGLKNAQKSLKELIKTHRFGPTGEGAAAEVSPKGVLTIDPDGPFMDKTNKVDIHVSPRGEYITLGSIEAAAFFLAHELGHKTNKLINDSKAMTGPIQKEISWANSGTIRQKCFSEAKVNPAKK